MEKLFLRKKLSLITDFIVNYLINANKELLENLNGNLDINLLKLDNPLFNKGKIKFSINEGKIKVLNTYMEIDGMGIIESNFNYLIREDELFLQTSNILNVNNKKEFARMFMIIFKKSENIKKIYFDFERNIDNGDMFLSNIFINSKNSKNLLAEVIEINNMQILKSIIRDVLP